MIVLTTRCVAVAAIAFAGTILMISRTHAQAPPPSERMKIMSYESSIAPKFEYARNMAILDRFGAPSSKKHTEVKNHEVKAFTRPDGTIGSVIVSFRMTTIPAANGY